MSPNQVSLKSDSTGQKRTKIIDYFLYPFALKAQDDAVIIPAIWAINMWVQVIAFTVGLFEYLKGN